MMFRGLLFGGLVAMGLSGAGPAMGPDEIICRDPGVQDGATLICGGSEIRLWDLSAPEPGAPGFVASKLALADLVRFREVHCQVRRNLGFRSDVAVCYVGTRDLAGRQVAGGHAARLSD